MPKDFKKLMLARLLFTFAVQMQAVVVGWQIYELLLDPLALGLVGLAEAVPALGLALYAGHIVDRSRSLLVYRRVIFVSLISGLLIYISQIFKAKLGVQGQVIALYAASFLTGTARAFSQPAMYASVPRILARKDLSQASAWMSGCIQIGRIGGPAVGGVLFGWFGLKMTALAICTLLLAGMLSISLMSVLNLMPLEANISKDVKVKENFFSGVSFVYKHPLLLPALSLDMFSVLFGSVVALLPIYCKEILFLGPKGLGILRAAPSIGAIVVSFILARYFNLKKRAGSYLLWSVAGFGVCILVFAVSRNFTLSLVALALSGAFDSVSMVVRTAILQLSSPAEMRGRISAVNSIFVGSSNEIGEFESGLAAKLLGTVPSAIFGGVMCLVTVAVVGLVSPSLRKMNIESLES